MGARIRPDPFWSSLEKGDLDEDGKDVSLCRDSFRVSVPLRRPAVQAQLLELTTHAAKLSSAAAAYVPMVGFVKTGVRPASLSY